MTVGFGSQLMEGPGGAAALSYGAPGAGGVTASPLLNNAQAAAAPGGNDRKIPAVFWMFVFLIVGYWGLHQSLKAV